MRDFVLSVEFPTGTILVGGHSALAVGASSSHAKDHAGQPVIPATALRGALRETLEAVLRGAGLAACDSGTGLDPQNDDPAKPQTCALDEGRRCICCRLFGTRADAVESEARVFSSLLLGDASLVGDPVLWHDRQHVSVSRSHRSAASQRLFLRKTPDLLERRLVAKGYTVEPELDKYLEAAVRATTHLGSGRSVGLARVNLTLEWGSEIRTEISEQPMREGEPVEPSDLKIRVTLKSPTMLGGPLLGDNYRATRKEIPGSVLRGALGFAIARTLSNPDADEPFQTLVDEHRGASFGFLYPVDSDQTEIPGASPLTARACKSHPHEHGVVDTLLDRIAIACVTHVGQVDSTRASMLRECGECKTSTPLRSVPGARGRTKSPKTRVITRVSIERRRSSARNGALFSYELLEPGAVFEGVIRNVPSQSLALLETALRLPIYVGRGASSGWGEVEIEAVTKSSDRPAVEQRGEQFAKALKAHFEAAGLPTDSLDHLVPLSFLSPLLPDKSDDDGCATIAEQLGNVRDWPVVARRFGRDGSWDQRRGQPVPEMAVLGGAVYVARLDRPWHDKDTLSRLQALEREGFGRRRHQGYGHAIFFDPFILTREQCP